MNAIFSVGLLAGTISSQSLSGGAVKMTNRFNDDKNHLPVRFIPYGSLSFLSLMLALGLGGCASLGKQPNNDEIQTEAKTVVDLTTIKLGHAYIKAAKDDMTKRRDQMTNADLALGSTILAGFVALGDGALSNWNSRTTGRLGIFSAAMVGVQSTLSLKTQAAIMNKGIAALNCIEEQGDLAWGPLLPFDAYVSVVQERITQLDKAVLDARDFLDSDKSKKISALSRDYVNLWLKDAEVALLEARAWLNVRNQSVVIVNSGVKNAVNKVVQTTVENLASVLPDGSAFAKIGAPLAKASPQSTMGSPVVDPLGVKTFSSLTASDFANDSKSTSTQDDENDLKTFNGKFIRISTLLSQLNEYMTASDKHLTMLSSLPSMTANTISCGVETVSKPLAVSNLSAQIVNGAFGSAWASIDGGKPPYTNPPKLTGISSNQAPEKISATVADSIVILKASNDVPIGDYILVVSDAVGSEKSLQFTVLGAPIVSNKISDQTFQPGKLFSFKIAPQAFTDPQQLSLTYKFSGLPSWLTSDNKATPTITGTAPASDQTPVSVTVTATSARGLSTNMSFKITMK
jgi:hypothetical protein